MNCPFCGGLVEDENCLKCGSLEGFTAETAYTITKKPTKMIAVSEAWTTAYSKTGCGSSRTKGNGDNVLNPNMTSATEKKALDEDTTDMFESSCFGIELRTVDVTVGSSTYYISQQMEPDDLAPLFSDVWTGSQVWRCSVISSQFINTLFDTRMIRDANMEVKSEKNSSKTTAASSSNIAPPLTKPPHDRADGSSVSSIRCIELGSGCGLLAIHAARLGMARVVATDQTAMVRLANHNIHVRFTSFCM